MAPDPHPTTASPKPPDVPAQRVTRPDVVHALAPDRLARAAVLARPAARRVAEVLATAPGGLTAHELGEALGVHHSGVRSRLAALEDVGAVEVRTDAPAGRGRPARRYLLAADPADQEAQGHAELIRLLMGLVSGAGFRHEEVERFGERQGAAIAREDAGTDEIRAIFERLGFAPRAVPGHAPDLVLERCPFADGVEAPGGELICALHEGLARGIARSAATGVAVTALDRADPREGGCRLRLAMATA